MKTQDLPKKNIAEISLIGTGGGYGESVVVHLGDNNWIVIDSCVDPNSKKCLPLEYLQRIGVNVPNDVKMIICTHWHDDHLLGISDLLYEAKNAEFCMARANDRVKFLRLVSIDFQKIKKEASNSSTREFNRCLEIIEQRKTLIKIAEENKTLMSINVGNGMKSQVLSLSPSDYTIFEFDKEISTLIEGYNPINKKIISKSPNSRSVVIYLKIGKHRALLGADLEIGNDNREGWLNILEKSTVIDEKSSLFKIPHHGSQNGYHNQIWVQLLSENPVSKLTPWNKNRKLPEAEILKILCSHSSKVYMTSPIHNNKPKKRSKEIEKVINRLKSKVQEIKFNQGIIRSRIDISNEDNDWSILLIDNALHVNALIEK